MTINGSHSYIMGHLIEYSLCLTPQKGGGSKSNYTLFIEIYIERKLKS